MSLLKPTKEVVMRQKILTATFEFGDDGDEFEVEFIPTVPARTYGRADDWDSGCGPEILSIHNLSNPSIVVEFSDDLEAAAMEAIERAEEEAGCGDDY
jgi:hypothetical protein